MRHAYILAALGLFFTTSLFSQTKADQVKEIQRKFKHINSDTGYQVRTLEGEQFLEQTTDGGGQLSGYFKQGQVRRIVESVGLSYGMLITEYYFWDGQLFFVYEKEADYPYVDSLQEIDHTTLIPAFEGRYYFTGRKIFETKYSGRKRFPDGVIMAPAIKAQQLLQASDRYLGLLKKKNN